MEVDKVEKKDNQKQNPQRGQRKKDLEQQKQFKEGLYLVYGQKGHIKKDYTKKDVKSIKVYTITIILQEDPVILKVGPKIKTLTES